MVSVLQPLPQSVSLCVKVFIVEKFGVISMSSVPRGWVPPSLTRLSTWLRAQFYLFPQSGPSFVIFKQVFVVRKVHSHEAPAQRFLAQLGTGCFCYSYTATCRCFNCLLAVGVCVFCTTLDISVMQQMAWCVFQVLL